MVVKETNLEKLKLYKKGKIRDIYDLDDKLLFVTTDRISAFDFVLPTPIDGKGVLLTKISLFWFDFLKDIIPNHVITADVNLYPPELQEYREILEGRSMLVKKAQRIDIECIVRGYITGSGLKEYQEKGTVCGIELPKGLKESDKLPEPIFTPSAKNDIGHDVNITYDEMKKIVNNDTLAEKMKNVSIELYKKASEYAYNKGIIIADTKFEFGIYNNELILIDEVFTPDSSRFWDKNKYKAGESQPSFDKQYVRDYLLTTDWDRNSIPPELPEEVVLNTIKKYEEAYNLLTK